jgi:hypothetical protein
MVLRLSDIGKGYRIDSDSGCGGLGVENAPESVRQIVLAYSPKGCSMHFNRVWTDRRGTTKGARLVESVAFVFPTPAAAAAGLRAAADFAGYVLLDPGGLTPSAERVALGDEAIVLAQRRHFTVVWRRGNVLSIIHVRGRNAGPAKRAALPLARRQDTRIEKPTPVPTGANDDREVALDNPRLGISVHWLGRSFAPGRGLPRLALESTEGPIEPEEGFEMVAIVNYEGRRGGVSLDLWEPARWARFMGSKLGRGSWSSPCARKRTVLLPRGHAEIFGGYAPREKAGPPPPISSPALAKRSARRCPSRRPDDFVAHVYLPGVVVAVNMPRCLRCDSESGRYESFKGLTAVVRGLRLRRQVGAAGRPWTASVRSPSVNGARATHR